jgi:hypothetical protein
VKVKIVVERTTHETGEIEVNINDAEFDEWLGEAKADGAVFSIAAMAKPQPNSITLTEFVEAHRDWPENIRTELNGVHWHFEVDELKLRKAEVMAPPAVATPKCGVCGRERGIEGMDTYDYNPIQVVTNRRFGWYSGDDGEVCPQDMEKMIRGAGL